MFGTKEEKKQSKVYRVVVDAARTTKNDKIVMIDLDVNDVKIKGCMLKEITVKQDGEKYKKGDTCYVVNFPSEKVGDKYYNKVWFPISNDTLDVIVKQVMDLIS